MRLPEDDPDMDPGFDPPTVRKEIRMVVTIYYDCAVDDDDGKGEAKEIASKAARAIGVALDKVGGIDVYDVGDEEIDDV
jgi:hypothetical protein